MRLLPIKLSRIDIFVIVLSFSLVALYVFIAGDGFPLDDSWIHQTYARNLAYRGEWAFIPGEPSAASTSPLYTVILSIGYFFRVPYLLWTHGIGAVSLAIIAMLFYRLMLWQFSNRRLVAMTGSLFILGTWHLVWTAVAGMETIVFSLLTIVLIYLSWREIFFDSHGQSLVQRAVIFGVFAGLTVLTRPEGLLLVGIIGLMFLVACPQGLWRDVITFGFISVVSFIVVVTPYLLLNYQLTGGLLPNTATAKFQQHEILLQLPYMARIQSLIIPILAGGQFLLIPGIFIYLWMVLRKPDHSYRMMALIPLIWSIGLILLYAARLPAAYQHGRYVIPALPSIVLMGFVGIFYAIQQWKYSLVFRVISRTLLGSALLASIVFTLIIAPTIYRTDVAIINQEMVASAKWIDENLPSDELLAIHDIGAVGYFASRPMLDIAGLVSPDVAPIVSDTDALWQLMKDRDVRYLMAFPDQIPGDDPTDSRLCKIFTTDGEMALRQGGANMSIYQLVWDELCLTSQ